MADAVGGMNVDKSRVAQKGFSLFSLPPLLLGIRLMVGQRSLTPFEIVRFNHPQLKAQTAKFMQTLKDRKTPRKVTCLVF